jgi:hypothetical protein
MVAMKAQSRREALVPSRRDLIRQSHLRHLRTRHQQTSKALVVRLAINLPFADRNQQGSGDGPSSLANIWCCSYVLRFQCFRGTMRTPNHGVARLEGDALREACEPTESGKTDSGWTSWSAVTAHLVK